MRPAAMPAVARPLRPALAALAALVLAAGVGACSLLPGAVTGPDPSVPLVVLRAEGGECPQGTCTFEARIDRDGRVTRSDGAVQAVDAASLRRLLTQVDAADWDAILARPFTGECPTAFDGQELTYTFATAGRSVTVASCSVRIDPDQEPFQTVRGILFAAGG